MTNHGFAVGPTETANIAPSAKAAEELGYSSFWVGHPAWIDGLAAMALAAEVTTRIPLGSGVVPLQSRDADAILSGVRENDLPVGRLILGIGSNNPGAIDRVRVSTETLRANLDVPVVFGALGEQMCRLAGEIADGVLFAWTTPDYARRQVDWVRAGADVAGRPAPRISALVRVALGEAGHAFLDEVGTHYVPSPSLGAHFRRMGATPAETAIRAHTADDIARGLELWDSIIDEPVLRPAVPEHLPEQWPIILAGGAPR